MISHEHMQKVVQRELGAIVGRRIVSVEPLTREQALALGFDDGMLGPNPCWRSRWTTARCSCRPATPRATAPAGWS